MNGEQIRLFMWGFQRHFQFDVQDTAKKLFQCLDPDYEIQTFLIGRLRQPSENSHPICLEPEDCGWSPEEFSTISEDTEHFLAVDGDHNLIALVESHMNSIQARRRFRAEKEAVLKVLNSHSRRKDQYHFSGFVELGKYDVGIILKIEHREKLVHYKLPKVYADEDMRVPMSLLDATIDIFMWECRGALLVRSPEYVDSYSGLKPEEILRRAGDRMMQGPVLAANGIGGLYALFDACNYIASLNYEGEPSNGGIIIADEDHQNVKLTLRLKESISLREFRAIRKMLQVSRSGDSLISNGSKVIGIGRTQGYYDQSRADLLQVHFVGHHKWELFHERHKLMEVRYGLPRIPLPAISESQFRTTCELLFDSLSQENIKFLYELTLEACLQSHGAILIFSPSASQEATRIGSQATLIEPIKLSGELLRNVTSIDGAVLADLEGICHAIGTILDGDAVEGGDRSRGARFNSSFRYCAKLMANDIPCLIVVISEDGSSEILPNLPRKVSRGILSEQEAALDQMLIIENHPDSRIWKVIDWMELHRFYLSQAICDKINTLLERDRTAREKQSLIYVSRAKFEPNAGMSESFFTP